MPKSKRKNQRKHSLRRKHTNRTHGKVSRKKNRRKRTKLNMMGGAKTILELVAEDLNETEFVEALSKLLGAGAGVNEKRAEDGMTPLMIAAGNKQKTDKENLYIVKELMRHGADLGIEDDNGKNVLYYAALAGMSIVSKYLREVKGEAEKKTPSWSRTSGTRPAASVSAPADTERDKKKASLVQKIIKVKGDLDNIVKEIRDGL